MKVDDDVFVNPDNLWDTLESTKLHSISLDNSKRFINYALIGKTMVNIPPVRDVTSKFYLSPSVYSREVFPSYLQGLAYILTGSLLQPIYSCTLRLTSHSLSLSSLLTIQSQDSLDTIRRRLPYRSLCYGEVGTGPHSRQCQCEGLTHSQSI